jgi:hypothetical protein
MTENRERREKGLREVFQLGAVMTDSHINDFSQKS